MYGSTVQKQNAGSRGRRRRENSMSRGDRVRLMQLAVCLGLFLTVFVGKGIFPQQIGEAGRSLLSLLTANTDFRAAFTRIGASISEEETVWGTLGDFCVEVFGAEAVHEDSKTVQTMPQLTSLLEEEQDFLNERPDGQQLAEHYLAGIPEQTGLHYQLDRESVSAVDQPVQEVPQEPVVAAVGAVLLKANYSGQPLPERCTMDQLSLGALKTTTPVLGRINSGFGYRDHPINGKNLFHSGVDIGGQAGDTIRAFAAGTVEYIGEDDSYGLYLQLDHGNGIRSFYAHCRALSVKKGQTVALGEKIGEVGSSGAATGPHLHLELKCQGLRVNPLYYIDCLSAQ